MACIDPGTWKAWAYDWRLASQFTFEKDVPTGIIGVVPGAEPEPLMRRLATQCFPDLPFESLLEWCRTNRWDGCGSTLFSVISFMLEQYIPGITGAEKSDIMLLRAVPPVPELAGIVLDPEVQKRA